MTGVVERNLLQSQILRGIQDKNTVVPEDFLDVLAFWQGEIFNLKVVKYLDDSKSLKTESFICLC